MDAHIHDLDARKAHPADHGHDHGHDHGPFENVEVALTVLTVLGMVAGLVLWWFGRDDLAIWGYGLVYLAGGLPSAWTALNALLRRHVLDIDLLMVVAAVAAATVGAIRARSRMELAPEALAIASGLGQASRGSTSRSSSASRA